MSKSIYWHLASVLCLFLMIASAGLVQAATPQAGLDAAVGRWVSQGCETRSAGGTNKLYVKRDATFTAASSTLVLTVYGDADCKEPNLGLTIEGPYTVGNASAAVSGASEADFKFTSVTLTPSNEGAVKLLSSAPAGTCGQAAWKVNESQNISETGGCAVLGVDLKNCGGEFDLLKVEGDKLYYGERPADGSAPCTPQKRPTTLQVPLVKLATDPTSLAKAYFTAINEHDINRVLSFFTDEATLTDSNPPAGQSGIYQGKSQIQTYWKTLLDPTQQAKIEGSNYQTDGNKVTFNYRISLAGLKGLGVDPAEGTNEVTVENGKITGLRTSVSKDWVSRYQAATAKNATPGAPATGQGGLTQTGLNPTGGLTIALLGLAASLSLLVVYRRKAKHK